MSYADLYYYKFEDSFENTKSQIDDGTEYAVMINRDFMCYLVFKVEQEIGIEKFYGTDSTVKTYVDWWNGHPNSFPKWNTRGEEPIVPTPEAE